MSGDVRSTTFNWTVSNFDIAPHSTGERLQSPPFSIDGTKKSLFSLLLYPRGHGTGDENHVSVFLKRLHDQAAERLRVAYEVCLVGASATCGRTHTLPSSDFLRGTLGGFNRFCSRSLLFARPALLPDNKLTVRCRIRPTEEGHGCEYMDCLSDCEELSRDFQELLQSGVHSDLTIEARGEEFRVHKAILEARWPRLTTHLLKTEEPDVKTLPGVRPAVLKAMLRYAYTGVFEERENIAEVLVAADQHELADLKSLMLPHPVSVGFETVIESVRLSFGWTVPDFKNFSRSSNELHHFLISDDVPVDSWMEVSLSSAEERKGPFLKFQKLGSPRIGAVHLKILASNGNEEQTTLLRESVEVFRNGQFAVPLDAGEVSPKVLVNGDLQLRLEIRASTDCGQSTTVQDVTFGNAQARPGLVCRNLKGLHQDLLRFYKSVEAGDVTLNVGPEKLVAHRTVLSARSDVFSKMFRSQESRTDSLTIEDVDKETMASVLMYMYCGVTDDVMDVPKGVKLYAAADEYQLPLLKEKCRQYLTSSMDVENVGEVLLLADAHSDENFKRCVYDFIQVHAGEILSSQRGLKVLGNRSDLCRDILNELSRRFSLQDKADGTDKKESNASYNP